VVRIAGVFERFTGWQRLAGRLTGSFVGDSDARRSDWVIRVRFWGEITRDDNRLCADAVGARLSPQSPVA